MRHNGLGGLLDPSIRFRKLLSAVVLATDMSVHFEFMKNFAALLDGTQSVSLDRKTLMSQALIKCADISNPVSFQFQIYLIASFTLVYLSESASRRISALGERVIRGVDISSATGGAFSSPSNSQTFDQPFRRS